MKLHFALEYIDNHYIATGIEIPTIIIEDKTKEGLVEKLRDVVKGYFRIAPDEYDRIFRREILEIDL